MGKVITNFSGRNAFLSNFYSIEVTYKGMKYRTSEHAYQAAKADNVAQRKFIALAPTPEMAKRRAKACSKRGDWKDVKIDVMWEILRAKFSNLVLRELLLETGDAELIEANTWGDVFWGVCGGVGENWLGRLLMGVREELRVGEKVDG